MRNDNLISYHGAWIYPVQDGTWEGNLKGFHYSADTKAELQQKIDSAIQSSDVERTLRMYSATPEYCIINEEDESEVTWVVTYSFELSSYDDEIDGNSDLLEVEINAPTFNTACKYAEQYLRKEALSDDRWKTASVVSIIRR